MDGSWVCVLMVMPLLKKVRSSGGEIPVPSSLERRYFTDVFDSRVVARLLLGIVTTVAVVRRYKQ